MDIRALKIFNHLAGSLHFGRTSRACHLTPSALTRTIQRMEEELGYTLFHRDSRKVSLTPAGELLKKYAEDMEIRWQQLQHALAADTAIRGEISLYCSVTAATSILPRLLFAFRTAYPGVHIKLQTGDAAEALERLQSREAELTIAALPERLPHSVSFIELASTPLVFIEAATTATQESAAPRDWAHTPMILAEQGLSRERIDHWFAEKNIQPEIYAEVAGNEALLAMVSLGCGVGVIPKLVLEKSALQDQVRIFTVSPELTPFTIGACLLRKQLDNPVVKAFWEVTQRTTGQMVERMRPTR